MVGRTYIYSFRIMLAIINTIYLYDHYDVEEYDAVLLLWLATYYINVILTMHAK